MTTDDSIFLDTNIVLRATHPGLDLHTVANQLLVEWKLRRAELWISRQVIREYVVQITRPGLLAQPLNGDQVEAQINGLRTVFRVADETEAVTEQLIALLKRFPSGGKQIHDLNIVATMQVYGVKTLATTNYEDMKRFEPIIQIIHVKSEK